MLVSIELHMKGDNLKESNSCKTSNFRINVGKLQMVYWRKPYTVLRVTHLSIYKKNTVVSSNLAQARCTPYNTM